MNTRTSQLQIRVSPEEKAAIHRYADEAGLDASAYVRMRALPDHRGRFDALVVSLAVGAPDRRSYDLADLNDLLASLSAAELEVAIGSADVGALTPFTANYVAAMVEVACARAGLAAPDWAQQIDPLREPWFAVPLEGLRPQLLRASPVPFKRRNIFVDATVGDRV